MIKVKISWKEVSFQGKKDISFQVSLEDLEYVLTHNMGEWVEEGLLVAQFIAVAKKIKLEEICFLCKLDHEGGESFTNCFCKKKIFYKSGDELSFHLDFRKNLLPYALGEGVC